MSEPRKNEPKIDADEVLNGIVEWVSIESPSHDAKSVNKVVDHVEGQFRDLGLKLDRTPGVDGFGDILECKTPPEMEPAGRRQGHPGAGPSRYRPSDRHDREGPQDPPRGRQHLRARHLRHEGGRLHRLLRAAPPDPAGQEDQAAGHLPVHPRGGGRQPDLARPHRGGRARPQIRAGDGARPRRRPRRHLAQGRRPLHAQGEGRGQPCRRAPPGRPQRHPRDGPADHAHRGQDRLRARHHLQCRADQRRHGRQRRAGRMHGRGRPARADHAARRGDDALVPEPRADRQGRRADGRPAR